MSFNYNTIILNIFVLFSININICLSRLVYDSDDEILGGTSIGAYCKTNTQTCMTNFEKNVFVSDNPIMDRDWAVKLFPWYADQFDDDQACGTGAKLMDMETCSQIHCPKTILHPSGELDATYVTHEYGQKWEYVLLNSNKNKPLYDSFFDYSVAYWVNDLSYFEAIWKEVHADIIYLKWQGNDDNTYYSMITHHGKGSSNTLTQYELVSDTFTGIEDKINNQENFIILESEQRIYLNNDIIQYQNVSKGCKAYPIGARRSVSDLDKNIAFYKDLFNSIIDSPDEQIQQGTFTDYNGNTVRFAHILLQRSEYSSSISFFQRDNTLSTYGELTVSKYELKMNQVHNSVMLSPYCGFDRWFDMHYALNLGTNHYAGTEALYNIMLSGNKYSIYTKGNIFLYVVEPNGHSVQFVFPMDSGATLYTSPTEWANSWCPMNCSDEQISYDFGDAIFEWNLHNDSAMTRDDYDSYNDVNSDNADNQDNSNELDNTFINSFKNILNNITGKSSHNYYDNRAIILSGVVVLLVLLVGVIFTTNLVNRQKCKDCKLLNNGIKKSANINETTGLLENIQIEQL